MSSAVNLMSELKNMTLFIGHIIDYTVLCDLLLHSITKRGQCFQGFPAVGALWINEPYAHNIKCIQIMGALELYVHV